MRAVHYVRQTTIPDTGNPSCKFFKVDADGDVFQISPAGFHQARRKGEPWFHEIVLPAGWMSFIGSDLGVIRAVQAKSDPTLSKAFLGQDEEPPYDPPTPVCSWCGDPTPCECDPQGLRLPPEMCEPDPISHAESIRINPDGTLGERIVPEPAPAIRAHKPIRRSPLGIRHDEAGLESGGPGEL